MYVAEWNEVPIVADKIILLPWLPSLNSFEHNKCSLLCCWQDINHVSVILINTGPSNASLELVIGGFIVLQSVLLLFSYIMLKLFGSCEDSWEIRAPWEVQTRKSCGKGG